jgi:hypothetical protein
MKHLRRLSRVLVAVLLRRKPCRAQEWPDEHAFIG